MRLTIITIIVFLFGITSCSINTDIMLRTPKDYVYDTPSDSASPEYVIAPNDIISFRLFANEAYKILDATAGTETQEGNRIGLLNQRGLLDYPVDQFGLIRVPILDTIKIAGYTIREAEIFLQELYSEYYVDPYVQVIVTNRRAIVFNGEGSGASVVPLMNNNQTLMEVLAQAGGIANRGRAARIKVIRKVGKEREIYLIDLSTIEGLEYVDMVIQANDYIYVEPVPEIGREILQDIAPVLSIISSAFVIYGVINTLAQ